MPSSFARVAALWLVAACGGGHSDTSAFVASPTAGQQAMSEAVAEQAPAATGQAPTPQATAPATSATATAGTHAPGEAGSPASAGAAGNPTLQTAGAGGTAGTAAGSGGAGVAAVAGADAQAAGSASQSAGPLTLHAVDVEDLGDGFVAFPDAARPPMNRSPGFRWTGVPAEAKSLALVFRDVSSPIPPVKWILWNIPPDRTEIPANVPGSAAMPAEVAGASQLGSLGNQGYAGPCCVGNEYEWIIYALDVTELPGTERQSTGQINMNILPMHTLEKSAAVMMRIAN
jgi:Raf kinase inhibitor-like YbhB/YbcL family protein